jgi:hypothetical protein
MGAYEAVIFVHVMGVMAFLLGHGISVGVSLRLRKERDPQRARGLSSSCPSRPLAVLTCSCSS